MSLFQSSVLHKYLNTQDEAAVKDAFNAFTDYFHNPTIQENIRESKEEQFQEGFLTELFVKVLGYVINPNPDYNLTTEFKNQTGAKKADGAILKDGKAIGVVELKSTKTKDLETVRQQAFDYKANQAYCVYVITSNFEKLRFYIHNAVDFEEFDLFRLTYDRFQILYLCLANQQILKDTPQKIKEESVVKDELITKQLYADYSVFKRELFEDLVNRNMENPLFEGLDEKEIKKILFQKSQKLLDRFLFIFFAEDRGLLPPNSITTVLNHWKQLQELDEYKPLYDRYKKYFGYLNTGFKGKEHYIYAYNGGLFKPDELLDSLLINDDLLYWHTAKLTAYDFETEVDVNILGHIFENSLNEIETVNAEIEGVAFEKQTSKRKKDGVFYTPKYITKYIVDNTVGRLCQEKKKELGIIEEDYLKTRKGRKKDTLKALDDKLKTYRDWLLQITICDPACGSGAFLNQALNFLIEEHHYIDQLGSALLDLPMVFRDVENSILENNLYGVDLNDESVEIARLSLWLRTVQKGRKLTTLSDNIKCGNSLIDDPEVADDKAFNWQQEFPEVFKRGGFDVVIGNPPYVRQELIKTISTYLEFNYKVFSGKADLYTYFFELGHTILKENGFLSFIASGKFFEASYGKPLVSFLVEKFKFDTIINFDDIQVFEGISAYPLIFSGSKGHKSEYLFKYCFVPKHDYNSLAEFISIIPFDEVHIADFVNNGFEFYSKEIADLFKKVNNNSLSLKDIDCLPLVGIKTGYNEGFLVKSVSHRNIKNYVFGKNLKKYVTPRSETKIIFPYERNKGQYELMPEENLGLIDELLNNHRRKLESRAIIKDGIKNGTKSWYEYQQINRKLNFEQEYIVYPNVSLGTNFTISKGNVIDMTGFIIPSNDKFLLAILNSSLTEFLMRNLAITRRGGYQEYKVQYLEKIPLKTAEPKIKNEIITLASLMITLSDDLQKHEIQFVSHIMSKYQIEKVSKKINSWDELEFGEFLKELKKANVQLSLAEEAEWMSYFNVQKQKAQNLISEINRIDKEIDQMVYELYGLTEAEIGIVEGLL